jgi:LCP family protein required for cell wall assembly
VNILVMGLDDRPGLDDGARADTLMVVHIPAAHDRVSVLSVPRDAMVDIPGHGVNRANSAYAVGGAALTASTVSTLTGLHIDHTVEVHMPAIVALTDKIGGVPVCLRAASRDLFAQADFPAGQQTISGPSALAFVRQRHGLPDGDLDRILRQQAFLRAVLDKAGDPAVRDALLTAVVPDKGWDVAGFAAQVKDLAGKPVITETVPAASEVDRTGGLRVDPAALRELVANLDTPNGPGSGGSAPQPGPSSPPCVN